MNPEPAAVQDCRIRIAKDGTWFYNDLPIINRTIYLFFNQHLEQDGAGGYRLRVNGETCPVTVEDTPFLVTDVWRESDPESGRDALYIRLNDETAEKLDLGTLFIRPDNAPCCRVKNSRFPARFTRAAYYRMAEYVVEHEDGRFSIPLNGMHYFL